MKILYITAPSQPVHQLNTYVQAMLPEHDIIIPSFKTLDTFDHENVSFYGVSDTKWIPAILRLFLNLLFLPNKDEIDIVYSSHKEWMYGIINVIYSRILGKKSVVKFAGNITIAHKYKDSLIKIFATYILNRWIALPLLRHADAIITLSNALEEILVEEGYDAEKIIETRTPMDYTAPNKVEPKCDELTLSEEKESVLFAGSLVKRKGMDTFLTILEEESIRERYHFIFAGKDNWGYGEKLSDYGNTTLLGKIPKKELFRYYHCVDVFVFPSYYEGYPKVIPEAYATGCPIIARDILDVHELADIVFEEDEELIRILNTETLQRKSTVQFPKKFNKTYQKQQYLKAVECSFE